MSVGEKLIIIQGAAGVGKSLLAAVLKQRYAEIAPTKRVYIAPNLFKQKYVAMLVFSDLFTNKAVFYPHDIKRLLIEQYDLENAALENYDYVISTASVFSAHWYAEYADRLLRETAGYINDSSVFSSILERDIHRRNLATDFIFLPNRLHNWQPASCRNWGINEGEWHSLSTRVASPLRKSDITFYPEFASGRLTFVSRYQHSVNIPVGACQQFFGDSSAELSKEQAELQINKLILK